MSWFKDILKQEPALIAWMGSGGVASLLAFVFHLGSTQEAAAATIVTALAAVLTGLQTHPFNVSILTGAAATIMTASAAFGLHLSGATTAAIVTLTSTLVGLLVRGHVSPTPPAAAAK
jgi:hypothetical protein